MIESMHVSAHTERERERERESFSCNNKDKGSTYSGSNDGRRHESTTSQTYGVHDINL
jgi:hypothetical protein